jgi:hypothetical protein
MVPSNNAYVLRNVFVCVAEFQLKSLLFYDYALMEFLGYEKA